MTIPVPGYENLLGAAEQEFFSKKQPHTGTDSKLGKNEFLNLLLVQLQHQDPTSPLKDEDFIAQLAQFSSLEQLTNISDSMNSLNTTFKDNMLFNAASFIGKKVTADGWEVSKEGNEISSLFYTLDDTASHVYINIYDGKNNLIQSLDLGAKQPGIYEFKWDGKDFQGVVAPDGVYKVGVSAEDKNGKPLKVATKVEGVVSGISLNKSDVILNLEDGRSVNWQSIVTITGADELDKK